MHTQAQLSPFSLSICSPSLSCFLLQVIKNPVTDHLPTGALKIGTSFHADNLVDVKTFAKDKPVVFVVGAMAHGRVSVILTTVRYNMYCGCQILIRHIHLHSHMHAHTRERLSGHARPFWNALPPTPRKTLLSVGILFQLLSPVPSSALALKKHGT